MPKQAQCAVITPPPTFSGSVGALKHTYNMPHEAYLIQTPSGEIVLGGGFQQLVDEGKMKLRDCVGIEDDSFVHPLITDCAYPLKLRCRSETDSGESGLARYCRTKYDGWGPEGLGEGLTRVWTGILTSVKDTLPLVGPVPRSPGLFIAAG